MTSAFAFGRSHTALALVLALGSTLACSSNNAGKGKTPELTEGRHRRRIRVGDAASQRGPSLIVELDWQILEAHGGVPTDGILLRRRRDVR